MHVAGQRCWKRCQDEELHTQLTLQKGIKIPGIPFSNPYIQRLSKINDLILGADARYAAHELRDAKDVAKKYCGVAEKPHAYLASLLEESKKMTQNWSLRSRFCMGCLGDMLYKYLNVSYKHIVSW